MPRFLWTFLLLAACFGTCAAESPNSSSRRGEEADSGLKTGPETPPAHVGAYEQGDQQQFVVGLSPFLDKSVKDDVYRSLVLLLVQDLPLDSTVIVYDAFHLQTITRVTLPNARAFASPKTRANQFATAILSIRRFLAADHTRPMESPLPFENVIRLPEFYEFLGETFPGKNPPMTVLLVGSPLYVDAKEPAFSMVDGYFPSDAHLRASRIDSVFGLGADVHENRPLAVHWFYLGDPWQNELHKEKVTRFWTLYLEQRASALATFSGDLSTVVRAFQQGATGPRSSLAHWSIDPGQTKIEMLRVTRTVDVADWITRDSVPKTPVGPPTLAVGPMKIGIRWQTDTDLDLYATPRSGEETLFFQHPRSRFGSYYKDHRTSPGREYEFIEFDKPVDVRQVEAFVNFYQGSCPGGPHGEVRIEFDGRIYSGPFSIPAAEGNRGRTGRAQEGCWVKIPIQKLLHLDEATLSAR